MALTRRATLHGAGSCPIRWQGDVQTVHHMHQVHQTPRMHPGVYAQDALLIARRYTLRDGV